LYYRWRWAQVAGHHYQECESGILGWGFGGRLGCGSLGEEPCVMVTWSCVVPSAKKGIRTRPSK